VMILVFGDAPTSAWIATTSARDGAGAVVRGHHPSGAVIAGVPARLLRARGEGDWADGLHSTPPRRRPSST
jgi:serine acetyltransferase